MGEYIIETIESLPCGLGPFFRRRRLQAIAIAHHKAEQAKALALKQAGMARQASVRGAHSLSRRASGTNLLHRRAGKKDSKSKIVPTGGGSSGSRLTRDGSANQAQKEDAAARVIQRQARSAMLNDQPKDNERSSVSPTSAAKLSPIVSPSSTAALDRQLAQQQRQIERQQQQIQLLLEQQTEFLRQLRGSPPAARGSKVGPPSKLAGL